MKLRKGPYLILRGAGSSAPLVTGGTTIAGDDPNSRAWLIKEMLRQASNITAVNFVYTLEHSMNPTITIDREDLTVSVGVGGGTITFSVVHAEDHLRPEQEPGEPEEQETTTTAQNSDSSAPIQAGAICGCGHKASNHIMDDGDVFCKVCEDYADDCQDLLNAA